MGRKRGQLILQDLSLLFSKVYSASPPETLLGESPNQVGTLIPKESPLGSRTLRSCQLVLAFILLFLLFFISRWSESLSYKSKLFINNFSYLLC